MNRLLFCALAVLVSMPFCANAQTLGDERFAEPASAETTQSVSLAIPLELGLHYSYEHPFARRATIIGRVGANAGASWGYGFYGSYSYWAIVPSIDIEPRFYYGLDRREMHARNTDGNAGSFLALQVKNMLPFGYASDSDLEAVGATFFTPMWGLRRVWGDHWLFEFTAGYTYAWGWEGGYDSSPHLGVRFGYTF
jgi:hypothetical protein